MSGEPPPDDGNSAERSTDRGSSEGGSGGVSESDRRWSRPQNAIVYQEARAMIGAQQSGKQNLDNAALRTSRLTVAVVSVFVTLVVGLDASTENVLTIGGGLLLLVAFGGCLVANNYTQLFLGPNEPYFRELGGLESDYTYKEPPVENQEEDPVRWENELVANMAKWTRTNRENIRRAETILLFSEICLFFGASLVASAIVF